MAHEEEHEAISSLLEIMHEHDLDRIKVKLGDATYELVRREAGAQIVAPQMMAVHAAPSAANTADAAAGATLPPNAKRIVAPLTGVFYRAASPDAESFVNEGDRVEVGSALCILEAMKLFNEIQSDYAGTILRIIPQNGELVSQGEELFWVQA
ncbi:MAG TPA: biotin/lipoyl-containing protein [Candidatus Baltobacteraceae bacterium]|jgi:acetyl-CoA carboxylase biotin carboxyl carrier protein|nr:biotin/lipoyl-containing protein [Candidatus Baltobacteraceae bacterium]